MIKKSAIKKIITSTLAFIIMILICIFPKSDTAIKEEVIYTNDIIMPIYTMVNDTYVGRTNVIKSDEDIIYYIIKLLTKGANESNYLPNGFSPVLPEGTTLYNYDINDNILTLNFSKELLNTSVNDEEKMIESLIYSFCELDNIKGIKIYVDNVLLDKMPCSKKDIPSILDKSFGINKKYYLNDYKNAIKTTVYYMAKNNDNIYYLPITKITNDNISPVEIIINELKTSSIYDTNLISYLNASYKLKDYEVLDNAITLSFNNELLLGIKDDDLIEKVKYTLSLSLRDTYGINDIIINIE